MNVNVRLTLAGSDTGPFNIASDVTDFDVIVRTNVTRAELLSGVYINDMPDGTQVVRVSSVGVCTNFTDITLELAVPTTTTTTTEYAGTDLMNFSWSLFFGFQRTPQPNACLFAVLPSPDCWLSVPRLVPLVGDIVYTDDDKTIPLPGDDFYYKGWLDLDTLETPAYYEIRIDANGVITEVTECV